MCVLYTDADTINQMIKDDRVLEIGVYPEENWQDELSVATSSIQGTYVRDTKGYTGKGAVVGMIEATGVPDVSYSELKGANIIKRYSTTSSHATNVSTIIAGQSLGLAPKCTVYATYMTNSSSFIEEVEWLLDKGVSVINCSMRHGTTTGKYGIWDKWVDHIDMNHDVLFVKAAGNWDDEVGYVTSPGLAYNAITVGGYDDNNTAVSTDDTMWKYSSYNHANGTAEKPDIIAPAANFTFPGKSTSSGTSYSSPMVVGTVAQLLSAKPSLATQPGILKSVLLASAFRKISAGNYGSINYSPFFSNIEGAGKLDAKNALYVVNSGNYTYSYLSTDDFPYTKKFTASSSDNQARVALCWLKQCVINTGSHTDINNTVERTLSDLDLEVFDPNGNRVGYSMSYYNNVEIVEFNPAVTGTYTIKVKKNSGTTAKDFIYLAWW